MSSKDGTKERYTFLPHTSIQIIQIDTQEIRGTRKRREELLLGKTIVYEIVFTYSQNNTCTILKTLVLTLIICEGVIAYYGTEEAFINCPTYVENQDFQIIDLCTAYS